MASTRTRSSRGGYAPKGYDALEVDFAFAGRKRRVEGLTIGKYVRARQMLQRAQVSSGTSTPWRTRTCWSAPTSGSATRPWG